MPLHLATALSVSVSTLSVPIIGVTEMAEPMKVKASTSKVLHLTTLVDIEIAPSKLYRIIPMPIPATTSGASSSPPKLSLVVMPELAFPMHGLPE